MCDVTRVACHRRSQSLQSRRMKISDLQVLEKHYSCGLRKCHVSHFIFICFWQFKKQNKLSEFLTSPELGHFCHSAQGFEMVEKVFYA